MALKLTILSPERRLLEGADAEEVTLTTGEGMIQVLPGHAPIVGTLEAGVFMYRVASGMTASGCISAGFFEVKDDKVSLMAETIELQDEIDLERARRAQKQAEDTLRQADLDQGSFKKYQLKLERALIRQQVANKEFGA